MRLIWYLDSTIVALRYAIVVQYIDGVRFCPSVCLVSHRKFLP